MENFCMHSWHTVGEAPPYTLPESDRDIYILVEDDVVYDSRDYWPEVRKACLVSYSDGGFKWKLLDYNKNSEEEYLNHNARTVIAWRYDRVMVDKKDA